MKIYLEDVRDLPVWAVNDGWLLVRTYREVIEYLKTDEVEQLSLDHDLGGLKTGYDVLLWIEEKVVKEGFIPPTIDIHTSNPPARIRMLQTIKSIKEKSNEIKNR